MKNNKPFLLAVLSLFSLSLLVGCNKSQPEEEEPEENVPLEIGDTVKEWKSRDNFDGLPLDLNKDSSSGTGQGEIVDDFGNNDDCSLEFNVKTGNNEQGYISSDALEEPFFLEEDAKNGDIISLYFYAPSTSNLKSLQLQIYPSSNNNPVNGDVIAINDGDEESWTRMVVSYDSLETLGSIRLVYKAIDNEKSVNFFVDDINITLGEETVKTDYVFNDESLYQKYEDEFLVGTCLSASTLRNTTIRKITKDNFNSVTAENEGKPEQILDQAACQAKVGTDPSYVAITTKPFEKIYNFCEASHIKVRHHTFVWYSQTPGWFFNKDYTQNGEKASKDLMLRRMQNFIRETLDTINERWPGLVYAIDVSNEAIDNGLRKNNNNWYTTVGEDFVYYSFVYANQYKAEDQKLYYNDYSYDYNTDNCKFALESVLKKAIAQNLVDGVGIQGHVDSNADMDVLIKDAKMIHDLGLECQITELDITVSGTDDNSWKTQKEAYKKLIKKVLEANHNDETNINALIVWGVTDNTSWKSYQNPLMFTQNFGKKPCYYGFLEAIDEL